MTWKSYAAASGAGLLATYLFSAPAVVIPERTPARPPSTAAGTAGLDIEREAERLHMRGRERADYEEPSRNPFRFGARPVARPPARVAETLPEEPVVTPVETIPQPPPIRLSGIATKVVDGTRQRSAILITPAGILDVREGDAVGSEYRVARIAEDSVELVDASGAPRRLLLRP